MAGNVWEWTADWYDAAYYSNSPSQNPSGLVTGTRKVLRGGCCATPSGHVRTTYRNFFYSDARWQFAGIRLAR